MKYMKIIVFSLLAVIGMASQVYASESPKATFNSFVLDFAQVLHKEKAGEFMPEINERIKNLEIGYAKKYLIVPSCPQPGTKI